MIDPLEPTRDVPYGQCQSNILVVPPVIKGGHGDASESERLGPATRDGSFPSGRGAIWCGG